MVTTASDNGEQARGRSGEFIRRRVDEGTNTANERRGDKRHRRIHGHIAGPRGNDEEGAREDEEPTRRRDPSLWDPCPHRQPERGVSNNGTAHGDGVDDARRRCDRGGAGGFSLVYRLWSVWLNHRNKGCEHKDSITHQGDVPTETCKDSRNPSLTSGCSNRRRRRTTERTRRTYPPPYLACPP